MWVGQRYCSPYNQQHLYVIRTVLFGFGSACLIRCHHGRINSALQLSVPRKCSDAAENKAPLPPLWPPTVCVGAACRPIVVFTHSLGEHTEECPSSWEAR